MSRPVELLSLCYVVNVLVGYTQYVLVNVKVRCEENADLCEAAYSVASNP